MDRQIIYSQEQGRSFDILSVQKYALTAIGSLETAVMGTNEIVVSGLVASATSPTSMGVSIGAGQIYSQGQMDSTLWGAAGVDTTVVQQQGFCAPQTILLSTAGMAAGQSRWALIQAYWGQIDIIPFGDPTGGLLYYWNAENPATPLQGQGGSNTPQNTERTSACLLSVVYGAVAASGAETPPSPTSGAVPLYLIDLSYGQSVIITGQILVAGPNAGINVPSNYPGAPFVAGLLNQHHRGIAGQAPQIDLTSEVRNILPLTHLPASSANVGGSLTTYYVYAGNPNGYVPGVQGNPGVVAPDTCWDTADQILWACSVTGNASTAVWVPTVPTPPSGPIPMFFAGVDSGAVNAMVVDTLVPNIGSFTILDGMLFEITPLNTNTSPTVTLDIVQAGVTASIIRADGLPLQIYDIKPAPFRALLSYRSSNNTLSLLNYSQYPKINCQIFTSSGTYYSTTGTVYVVVETVAGGGGGGAAQACGVGYTAVGSSGGAGDYAKSLFTSGFSGGITITVGSGGAGGNLSVLNGGNGGNSQFGTLVSVQGGNGGVYGAPSTLTGYIVSGAGGGRNVTGSYIYSSTGGRGQFGLQLTAAIASGPGGSSFFGSGGYGAGMNVAGLDADHAGAGGSAGCVGSGGVSVSGGKGANGMIVVWEFGVDQ